MYQFEETFWILMNIRKIKILAQINLCERTVRTMFEEFIVPGVYLSNAPVNALYSSGRISGVVVDLGHDLSTVTPCYEGYNLPHCIIKYGLAGKHITKCLKTLLLKNKKINLPTSQWRMDKICRELKEKYCWITEKQQTFLIHLLSRQ